MALTITASVLLLLVAWISYSQILSVIDIFFSDAPIVEKSWIDVLFRKGVSVKNMVVDANHKYSKKGQAWRRSHNDYVLPPLLLEESRKLPTAILNSSAANEESLHLRPSLGNDYWDVINFVRQYVTRSIPSLILSVDDEVKASFAALYPPPNASTVQYEGKTYYSTPLHSTTLKIIGRIGTKILFGDKFSRDDAFTDLSGRYARGITIQALLLNTIVPSCLKAAVKEYVLPRLNNARLSWKIRDCLRGDVLACIQKSNSGLQNLEDESEEFTLLPGMVDYVRKSPDYKDATPERLAEGVMCRMLGLIFAILDTSSITFTQLTFDLIGYPKEQYTDKILCQIRDVSRKYNGIWNMASLGELRLLDSFIKESQRVHPISVVLGSRVVMPDSGYSFSAAVPGAKPLHFAKGSVVTMPLGGVHFDPEVYQNPMAFEGFRSANDPVPSSQPTDKFMSFGHGRHACPGRHLALNVLKLMVIEFLENYEWIPIERPADVEFSIAVLPDMNKSIHVRRIFRQ